MICPYVSNKSDGDEDDEDNQDEDNEDDYNYTGTAIAAVTRAATAFTTIDATTRCRRLLHDIDEQTIFLLKDIVPSCHLTPTLEELSDSGPTLDL